MALWQLTFFISFLSGFMCGYNIESMSGAILFIRQQFDTSSDQSEDLLSALTWASLLATALVTFLVNRFGRKPILLLSAFLLAIGPGFALLADIFSTVDISRLLIGFGIGLNGIVVFLYISEVAPIAHKAKLIVLYTFSFSLGTLASDIVEVLLSRDKHWHIMLGIIAFPAVVQFIYLFYISESKYWLDSKKIPLQMNLKKTLLNFLPPKKYRHLFGLGLILATVTQAIGMDTLFNYAPIIYEKAGFKTATTAIAATGITNLVQVISAGLIYFYINEAQRKHFMAKGLIVLGCILVLLALSFWFLSGSAMHPWIVLTLLLCLTAAYNFAFISVAWVAIAEIFHDSVRAEGLAIATLVSYLFSVLLSQTYLNLWNILGGGGVFFMFALVCFASVYFVVRWLVETKELHIAD